MQGFDENSRNSRHQTVKIMTDELRSCQRGLSETSSSWSVPFDDELSLICYSMHLKKFRTSEFWELSLKIKKTLEKLYALLHIHAKTLRSLTHAHANLFKTISRHWSPWYITHTWYTHRPRPTTSSKKSRLHSQCLIIRTKCTGEDITTSMEAASTSCRHVQVICGVYACMHV